MNVDHEQAFDNMFGSFFNFGGQREREVRAPTFFFQPVALSSNS